MIYFIQCNSYIKIGYTSNNPEARLKGLQTGNPSKLKLLKVIEGSIDTEKELHGIFKDYRAEGEWFKYNSSIKNYIKDLISINIVRKSTTPKDKLKKELEKKDLLISKFINEISTLRRIIENNEKLKNVKIVYIDRSSKKDITSIQLLALRNIAKFYNTTLETTLLDLGVYKEVNELTFADAVALIQLLK